MDDMFTSRVNNLNLKKSQEFATERKKTVKCGLETVSYRCPPTYKKIKNKITIKSNLH